MPPILLFPEIRRPSSPLLQTQQIRPACILSRKCYNAAAMILLTPAASLVIGIAAVLTFYTALLHLTRKDAAPFKFRIIRDLIVGTQTLQLYFITRNLHLVYPFLLYPFITLLFISGTLNYIRYFWFFYPGGKIPFGIKTALIPVGILLAGETWFYFVNWAESQAMMQSIFSNPTHHPITLVIVAGVLVLLVQYVLILRLELSFINEAKIREPVLISSIITIIFIVDNILVATGFVLANPVMMHTGILLLGLTGITYLLFENRHPGFYQLVARVERQEKYRKSLLRGVNTTKIMARLQELMEVEKIYYQFDLKLNDVAALLLITPHQLSEFVNDQMGMNFASYVNHYRVAEAQRLLVNEPEKSTLSIGFEVGFGSKPSFNATFKQQTGMTPSEFRKKSSEL